MQLRSSSRCSTRDQKIVKTILSAGAAASREGKTDAEHTGAAASVCVDADQRQSGVYRNIQELKGLG